MSEFHYQIGDWVLGNDLTDEVLDFHGEVVQRQMRGCLKFYQVQDAGGTRHLFMQSELQPAEKPQGEPCEEETGDEEA